MARNSWESASGQAENRYLRFNMFSEGKDSGVGTDARWWRGEVSFYKDYPQVRYMGYHKHASWPRANHHVFIHTHNSPIISRYWLREYEGYALFIRVPDLAVFSKYPGDMLDVSDTHERVKLIMLHEIRELALEEAAGISGATLAANHISNGFKFRPWASTPPSYSEVKPLHEWLQDKYDSLVNRWVDYNHAFNLCWSPVPSMYEEEMQRVMKSNMRKYQDPKAVERRERARARKIALAALEIDVRKRA